MGKNLVKGYFKKNLGDDIFLKILLERYENNNFDIYSSFDYKEVYKTKNFKFYSTKNVVNIFRVLLNKFLKLFNKNRSILIENIKKYDNVILIGGSIFMENEQIDLEYYKNNQFNYKNSNYILGANFGPYKTKEYVNIHKSEIFPKVKDICFRDMYSYKLFKELPNTRCASDIVFSLNTNSIRINTQNIAVISVIDVTKDNMKFDQEIYNKKIVELINYLRKKNMKIILMSFSEPQGDEVIINDIMSMLEEKKDVEKYFYRGNIEQALDVLGNSKIVFGTRFHANILGLLLGKTVIPISYSDKTINVLKDMNFNGKIIKVQDIDKFDVNSLTEEDLSYKHDVSYQIKDAQRHFEKLDEVFNERRIS